MRATTRCSLRRCRTREPASWLPTSPLTGSARRLEHRRDLPRPRNGDGPPRRAVESLGAGRRQAFVAALRGVAFLALGAVRPLGRDVGPCLPPYLAMKASVSSRAW